MRKVKKSPRNNILVASIFLASILLSSCSNSIKSESNLTDIDSNSKEVKYIPASLEEMNLYKQIGVSYFCLARKAEVEFPQSISIASKNFALIVFEKHGALIEEVGDKKLSIDRIYQGSYMQIIQGAIQLCPDQVPEEEKNKFLKAVEKINEN